MNYAGPFGNVFSDDAAVSLTDHLRQGDTAPASHDTVIVPDVHLLFAGDFNRLGSDLILSRDGHEFVVPDYFRGEKRAALASPDGASLSGNIVEALTGHVQYAQAGDTQGAPRDIGQVSKLVGTATALRNGVLIELHAGDRVYKGDVVQAGPNSSASIVFIDGTVFGLSANAKMVLNEMVYDQAGTANSALISLVRGTITFVAGETAKHGDMKVDTPVATMGIRGTAVLVEIGFEIPSDGSGPPVNFQVLVEPDGSTGSYILYSKTTGEPIGTIDKAGQVYSVSGNGTFSNMPSPELTQVAVAIIQQVFQRSFPGYVPDHPVSTPQSGGGAGSTPANPPSGDVPQFHDNGDGTVTIPITIQIPNKDGTTTPVKIPVTAGAANTPPTIAVHDVVTDANNFTFKIADRVTITDPNAGDIALPYVPGSASFVSVVGPSGLPAAVHLNQLVTINPLTGAISYNPGAFGFLKQGQQVVVTIGFDSKSGPDTVHETIHLFIDGVNDAPVIQGAAVLADSILDSSSIHVMDPDSSSFTFHVTADAGSEFETTTDGINWVHADSFTSDDLAAGHVRFEILTSEVHYSPTFTISAEDDTHLTSPVFSAPALLTGGGELSNEANVTIDISDAGATNGFTFPGAGNVTTPGTPEDRIALGYHIGTNPNAVVLNSAPMENVDEFGHLGSAINADNSISTYLDAHNGVTLTQTITLGADANYFTTTINIANFSDTDITGVSFLRNFDPDQDVAINGNYQTFNQVLQNPDSSEQFAAVSATGPTSDVHAVLVGLGSDWHATFYGSSLEHSNPYDPAAFGPTPDPATSDQSITLIDNIGTVAAHSSVEITYLTTANVATNGDNALIGTSGNDTIEGLGGNDLLIGLGGADNFVFAKDSGQDTILDFKPGTDKIELDCLSTIPTNSSGQFTTAQLDQMKAANEIVQDQNDILIHLDGVDGSNTILLKNVNVASLHANDFIIHPGTS